MYSIATLPHFLGWLEHSEEKCIKVTISGDSSELMVLNHDYFSILMSRTHMSCVSANHNLTTLQQLHNVISITNILSIDLHLPP